MSQVKMDNTQTEEDIADIIGSQGSTYMSQICSKIFTYNISDPIGPINRVCRNWFIEALQHCSEILFLNPEPSVHTWLFHQVMNLRYIFIGNSETSLAGKNPQIRIHPEMLTRSDCNHLFVEAAKDYIEIAPKYTMCLEENFYYAAFIKALFGVLTMYLIFAFFRKLSQKTWWTRRPVKVHEQVKLSAEEEALMHRIRLLTDQSMDWQKFESSRLKVDSDNIKRLYYDPPLIAVKVKKKQLSDALCCLVKTDPAAEEHRNGLMRSTVTKSRGYAMHKLNLFLKNRSYCRIVLDIGYDEDESDSDVDGHCWRRGRTFLAGDQPRYRESTMDESADTSSLSSVRQHQYHNHEYSRPRRYASKYKTMYLQSIGMDRHANTSIPTITSIERHRDHLVRKESSNSVAILHRKDSRTLTRKGKSLNSHASGIASLDGATSPGGMKITKV